MLLASEIEHNDALMPTDFLPVVHRALRLADMGAFDRTIKLPDGRRMTIKKFLNTFRLWRLVQV